MGQWLLLTNRLSTEKGSSNAKNRILLESDGPFTKYRGELLSPLSTYHAVPVLAEIWAFSEDEVLAQLKDNLCAVGAIATSKRSSQ